jgi:hypothetical protein
MRFERRLAHPRRQNLPAADRRRIRGVRVDPSRSTGAVLWATILAIIFAPVCQRLAKSMGQRRNLAALDIERHQFGAGGFVFQNDVEHVGAKY